MSEAVRGIYPGDYTLDEIPQGVRVVAQFDDLVHPMRKIGYVRHGGMFQDDDGDWSTIELMRKWWSWAKFSEVTE